MVTVVKSEWHQVEKRYSYEITEDDIAKIYPDLSDEEISEIFDEIVNGERDIEQIVEAAWENDIEFDWEWMDEDDWWTDRKGGYEITYAIED